MAKISTMNMINILAVLAIMAIVEIKARQARMHPSFSSKNRLSVVGIMFLLGCFCLSRDRSMDHTRTIIDQESGGGNIDRLGAFGVFLRTVCPCSGPCWADVTGALSCSCLIRNQAYVKSYRGFESHPPRIDDDPLISLRNQGIFRLRRQINIKSMKTLFRYIFLLGALSCAVTGAAAGERAVFKGSLGKNTEVVLELEKVVDGYDGRYFYMRYGVDIPLHGTLGVLKEALPRYEHGERLAADDNSDQPIFVDPGTGKPRSLWQGKINGDVYEGTWHDVRKNKDLAFELHQVGRYNTDAIKPSGVEAVTAAITPGIGSNIAYDTTISLKSAPYGYLKMQFPLQLGPEVLRKDVGYRMVTDPRTKFAYPRLTRHPDAQILARINQILEQRHWQMSLAALECKATLYTMDGPAAGTLGDYDSETIAVRYLSATLISVVEAGSTYCGGAHPNNHYDPFTLDLVRGSYLDFNRLFPVWTKTKEGAEIDPVLANFISKKVKEEQGRKGSDPDTDCSDVLPEYLGFEFDEPDRISFVVSGIGHAMGVCLGPQLVLPIRALKPILKPGAKAYF